MHDRAGGEGGGTAAPSAVARLKVWARLNAALDDNPPYRVHISKSPLSPRPTNRCAQLCRGKLVIETSSDVRGGICVFLSWILAIFTLDGGTTCSSFSSKGPLSFLFLARRRRHSRRGYFSSPIFLHVDVFHRYPLDEEITLYGKPSGFGKGSISVWSHTNKKNRPRFTTRQFYHMLIFLKEKKNHQRKSFFLLLFPF